MSSMSFRIVDTFLFSEPYEKELLLLKFTVEDAGVDEWVMLENSYTLQGEKKPFHAAKVLEDKRFDPFRHKVKIIQGHIKGKEVYKEVENNDAHAFNVEFAQREMVREYLEEKYDDADLVVVSDTDESIDFSNNKRKEEIYKAIQDNPGKIVNLKLRRYWYDIDNEYLIPYAQTLIPVSKLRNDDRKLAEIRNANKAVSSFDTKSVVAFEYSHVFPLAHIERKFRTFAHTGYTLKDLRQSFRCNHRPASKKYGKSVQKNDRYFFKSIEIDQNNSPAYVLQNDNLLRTGHIDPDYEHNRRIDYPKFYTLSYILKERVKNLLYLMKDAIS